MRDSDTRYKCAAAAQADAELNSVPRQHWSQVERMKLIKLSVRLTLHVTACAKEIAAQQYRSIYTGNDWVARISADTVAWDYANQPCMHNNTISTDKTRNIP